LRTPRSCSASGRTCAELEQRLVLEIRRALDLYRGQLLAGIGLLVLGAIFLSAGNFVE
jgi:hypothetical protein